MASPGRGVRSKRAVLPLLVVLSVLLVLSGCAFAQAIQSPLGEEPALSNAELGYLITVDDIMERRGAVTVFNTGTGEILKRIETEGRPRVAISPAGDRLFVLEGKHSTELKRRVDLLSVIDTHSWETLASTTFPHLTGGLVVAPDGLRLFVYNYELLGDNLGDYWLSAVDPVTLEMLPTRIPLSNCGGAQFLIAKDQLVVRCYRPNTLHFIDLQANSVVATVPLPRGGLGVSPLSVEGRVAGFVIAKDQESIYVVTNDLRILEVSTSSHTIVRQVTRWRVEPKSVPVRAVEISRRGDRLIVEVLSSPWVEDPAFILRLFALPTLTPVGSVRLPGYAGFAAASDGGLYIMPSGKSVVQKLPPDLSQPPATLLQLDGLVHRLVVP